MPAIYEGEPLISAQQILKEEEYAQAYLVQEKMATPLNRRSVKIAACFSGIALLVSFLPLYLRWYSTAYGILAVIFFLLILAARFYFLDPARLQRRANLFYNSNQLIQQPAVFTIFRDSMEQKSENETLCAYWTDFYACYECRSAFLFVGGMERNLIIMKKEIFSEQDAKVLSSFFKETFAGRYHKC